MPNMSLQSKEIMNRQYAVHFPLSIFALLAESLLKIS
jgi:hypothetical protein